MALVTDNTKLDQKIDEIRKDFPILQRKVESGEQLIYFDNAATTQKPKSVVDALSNYYLEYNANVHRGIHTLSQEASEKYENAHQILADFVNCDYEEMIFTKNTTEGLNIVAYGYMDQIEKGDEIAVTRAEHHSNLVPYQQLCKRTGAKLKFIELDNFETIDLHSAEETINDNTKLVAFPHMSNVLGTITDPKEITNIAHEHGAKVILDAAQSVPHIPVDVRELNIDFMAFSGHKMLGPMGTGGLYGKEEELEELDPMLFGGDMISTVSYDDAKWNELPYKFEAGTPNVGASIALAEAVKYLEQIGMDQVREIEHYLTEYALDKLDKLDYVKVYGPSAEKRGGVVSFNVTGGDDGFFVHPHDVSQVMDEAGVAIRAGHHCAEPLMKLMEIPATSRMSFYIYNTRKEIDIAIDTIDKVNSMFN